MSEKLDSVRITNAAIEKTEGRQILRGVVDVHTSHLLRVDDYQREEMPPIVSKKYLGVP